jgi:hypothetical protein
VPFFVVVFVCLSLTLACTQINHEKPNLAQVLMA